MGAEGTYRLPVENKLCKSLVNAEVCISIVKPSIFIIPTWIFRHILRV